MERVLCSLISQLSSWEVCQASRFLLTSDQFGPRAKPRKGPLRQAEGMSNPLRGSGSEASLRRLVRNRTLTGALVVLAVIVAGVAGYSLGHTGGYASGYSTGYSDGNSDYSKIQESIKSTKLNYYGYLQLVLSKLAVDSQNKSVKSPNAGFESLYSVFKAANASSTVFGQNLTLCAPTARSYFQATATNTTNPSFTS